MSKKLLVNAFLTFFTTVNLQAQDCPPNFEKGTLVNVSINNKSDICFRRDPLPVVNPDVCITKYTILGSAGKEMYTVHFYFYKKRDSISIIYFNIATGMPLTKEVRFRQRSSIRMFRNYTANDTLITTNDHDCTLFTIPDTLHPYVSLNQFQLLDSINTYLSLYPVSPEKLELHLLEVAASRRWNDSVNIVRKKEEELIAKRKKQVADFMKEMREYKDSVIQSITASEDIDRRNEVPGDPGIIWSQEFKSKLDPLFKNYYKNIFPFVELNCEIKFAFTCNAEGKIDISKTGIDSVNSRLINWFVDSFKAYIEPSIAKGNYRTLSVTKSNPDLKTNFDKKFLEAFINLEPDNSGNQEFIDTKKEVYNSFENYYERKINVPTKYTYVIKYKCAVEYADWIYTKDRNGVETIGPKKPIHYISEELKNKFKNTIARPKIEKYHVKICTIYINDVAIAEDILAN